MPVSKCARRSALAALPVLMIAGGSFGSGFDETDKLLAGDGAAGDNFSESVAVSGTTAVIGAHNDDDNGSGSGSAYVFDTTTGQQLFKLLPGDGAGGDFFGESVAVSGTTAVIGARLDDDNGIFSGSAYVFDAATGQQLFKLLPTDGASGDFFGESVAVSGTTAVIGANSDDDNGANSGSAYVFDTTTGQQIFKLLPADGAANEQFGVTVAVSGTTAVIGASSDDDNGAGSGSAYVFDTATGQQLFKLLPNDGAASEEFGWSVAVSGTTAVIGARDDDNGANSGSAYVFDTTTGQQIFKLLPADGASFDAFSRSVAVSGTTAVIGASDDDDNGDASGSAYVFDTETGLQLFKLLSNDGALADSFGWSVAVSGATAVIGARFDDDDGINSGSAYVFRDCLGRQLTTVFPNDPASFDVFGTSVAVDSFFDAVVVGAELGDDNGNNSGAAYRFVPTIGVQVLKFLPNDGAASDEYGTSVDVNNGRVIVGANKDDDNGADSGSAYLHDSASGAQLHKLTANDGAAFDNFGVAVATIQPYAVVGANQADAVGVNSGAAYVFSTSTGLQSFKLIAGDAAAGDLFGSAVDVFGTTAIIGSVGDDDNGADSGSAYLFNAATGVEIMKLLADDGAASDDFGTGVSIWGDYAVVGAPDNDERGANAGAAYVFDVATGDQVWKLLAVDGEAGDSLGGSVAIDDTTIAVGAVLDDDGATDAGAVYLFSLATGQQLTKIIPGASGVSDFFGGAVALDNDEQLVVGARGPDINGPNSGAAYLFEAPQPFEIMDQPDSHSEEANENLQSFSVTPVGPGPFNYQWRLDGQDLVDVVIPEITGATSSSIDIALVEAHEGLLICVVDDGCRPTYSEVAGLAVLPGVDEFAADINNDGIVDTADLGILIGAFGSSLTPAPLDQPSPAPWSEQQAAFDGTGATRGGPPVAILADPVPAAATLGDPAESFAVIAEGSGLTYQWRFDGAPLADDALHSGTATDTLTVAVDLSTEGLYDVVVTDSSLATATSKEVALVVRSVLVGDLNRDLVVDTADLGILIGAFGSTGP